MTTCIVAQFPWTAIADVTQSESPGVIICTDTRVTTAPNRNIVDGIWAKQGRLSKNIYVCYASSHVGATTAALTRVNNTGDVRKIGQALKLIHKKYGGYTELLVVVWPKNQLPQILELMPMQYIPTPRRGIIGVGSREVLQSFRQNFFELPRPDLVDTNLREVYERIAQQTGNPVDLPRYRILDAAGNVGSALASAIQSSHEITVDIPIQLTSISEGKVTAHWMVSSSDSGDTWEDISAGPQDVKIPRSKPLIVRQHTAPSKAVQLFD